MKLCGWLRIMSVGTIDQNIVRSHEIYMPGKGPALTVEIP
jgi:hypothetical protein